jgi:hypothetical protein
MHETQRNIQKYGENNKYGDEEEFEALGPDGGKRVAMKRKLTKRIVTKREMTKRKTTNNVVVKTVVIK